MDVHVDGAGAETLVMVHGWPDTWRLWDGVVAGLKDRYRCVRFTLPGFDPATQRRAYPLLELMETLKGVIEQYCPSGRAILVLHDWGCVLGYEFAMRHPQLVSRIVGVDVGDPASWRRSIGLREKFIALAYQVWLAIGWKAGGSLGDWMTRRMARWAKCPSDERAMHSGMNFPYYLMWFGPREAFLGQLHRFRPPCPILFVYGRRKIIYFHAASWLDELRESPLNRVEEFDTGHWVMSEQPLRFNQVVGDWLAR